jgi:hypothetical protein
MKREIELSVIAMIACVVWFTVLYAWYRDYKKNETSSYVTESYSRRVQDAASPSW